MAEAFLELARDHESARRDRNPRVEPDKYHARCLEDTIRQEVYEQVGVVMTAPELESVEGGEDERA
jgi:hypothetical protein